MLLRSTSAPILNSCLPQQYCSRESSRETQLQRRSRSFSIFSSKSIDGHAGELLHQALSEHKGSTVLKPINKDDNKTLNYEKRILNPSSAFLVERLFLGEKVSSDDPLETLVGGGGGGGMGSSSGGFGGSGVDGGGNEDTTDTYYKEMIGLNPKNPLLTGNYAKFLKEVRGDMKKAEEYCERAILGNTNDGNVLSLYADLILQNHGDRKRAHSYFQLAIKMSPDDCYVQASYARFLWDVEDDEDEEQIFTSGHAPPTTISRDFPITVQS